LQRLIYIRETLRVKICDHYRELGIALEDIAKVTRAAKVIATSSRVEASSAGEYRKNLETVADGLQQAAVSIEEKVANCRNRLAERMAEEDCHATGRHEVNCYSRPGPRHHFLPRAMGRSSPQGPVACAVVMGRFPASLRLESH